MQICSLFISRALRLGCDSATAQMRIIPQRETWIKNSPTEKSPSSAFESAALQIIIIIDKYRWWWISRVPLIRFKFALKKKKNEFTNVDHRFPSPVPLVMSGYTTYLWPHDSQPQCWSKYQVWEWLQQVMDMHQIDASNIPFQNFDMDGHQLCSLSYQDFIRAAGSMGATLFHSITELKWNGASSQSGSGVELSGAVEAWSEGGGGVFVVCSCYNSSSNKAQRGCGADRNADNLSIRFLNLSLSLG